MQTVGAHICLSSGHQHVINYYYNGRNINDLKVSGPNYN